MKRKTSLTTFIKLTYSLTYFTDFFFFKAKAILKKKESDSMDGEEHTSASPTDTQLDESMAAL